MIKTYSVHKIIKAGELAQGYLEETIQPIYLAFTAPIDLMSDDEITVETNDGTLFCVIRNGEIIWGFSPGNDTSAGGGSPAGVRWMK